MKANCSDGYCHRIFRSSARRRLAPKGRDETQSPNPDETHEGVFRIGNGIGVVGQGHDLALVLQLPHVHEVGDVLEEDPREAEARSAATPVQAPGFKAPHAAAEAVAQPVQGDDQTLVEAAAKGRGPCVGLVMVHEVQAKGAKADGPKRPAKVGAAQGPGQTIGRKLGKAVLEAFLQGVQAAGAFFCAAG